jgi:hypothetical protein
LTGTEKTVVFERTVLFVCEWILFKRVQKSNNAASVEFAIVDLIEISKVD